MIKDFINRILVSIVRSYSFTTAANFIASWRLFYWLLICRCHEDLHHCGVENTLNKLQQTYWITNGKQAGEKVLTKYIVYKIVQVKTLLPPSTAKFRKYKLYFKYPFENLELDYAGPLFTYDIFGKSMGTVTSYILVLTCAATRNTHLELVSCYLQNL